MIQEKELLPILIVTPGFEQSNSDNDNEPGLVWVVFMRDDDEFEIGPLYALV